MEQYEIRQGDQCFLSFPVMLEGQIITESLITSPDPDMRGDVEITIGKLSKTFNKNEVVYNKIKNTFDFPLTQKETFSLRPGMRLKSQIRVKLKTFNKNENNFIFSEDGPDVVVIKSLSMNNI